MIDVQASGSGNGDSNESANGISNEYMSTISEQVDLLSESLRRLSLKIHDNPEVRYKEFIAHEAITTFIREQDDQKWKVTPSAYGIATAFVAVFGSGRPGPVVSFNAEYGKLF
jgi:metal-dependent amidase/aminoacylase/carboxypeptidase family protein